MNAFTVEIGSNLLFLVTPVVTALVIIIQNRFANKQLKPNGGTSLRDSIDRIEAKQTEHAATTTAVLERLDKLEHPLPPPHL